MVIDIQFEIYEQLFHSKLDNVFGSSFIKKNCVEIT